MSAALAALLTMTGRVDVARRGGGIKGDEATYVGMAASLAFDHDVTFDGADYSRFRAWYGGGPEGIFLKRGEDGTLYFGKAYIFGLLAAPFARLGGLEGLLAFNLACLAVVFIGGWWWLAPGSSGGVAPAAFTAAFLAASVAPLYAFWLTSDVLNFTLVFVAFALGASPPGSSPPSAVRRTAGVVCLAAAIFSKPLNLPLAVPLALTVGAGINRRAAATLAAAAAAVLFFFAANVAMTGELNYQGGERKTFYGEFPFDEEGHSFDTAGIRVATDALQAPTGPEGRLLPLGMNVGYFFTGRHFGLLPFGWPWLAVLGLWAVAERRKALWQWALVGALAATALITIVWMPYTWSGGGGPVGNRYFLSPAAASFFLVPRIRSIAPALVAALGLVFVAPSLAEPFTVARQPWLASRPPQFSWLPLELTGASDFPVILDQRRGRIPQGREPTVFVALLDAAAGMGRSGWIAVAAHERSALLVRSPVPLRAVTVGVKTPLACAVGLSAEPASTTMSMGEGERRDVDLTPAQTYSRDSFVFVLEVDASRCDAAIEAALQGRR